MSASCTAKKTKYSIPETPLQLPPNSTSQMPLEESSDASKTKGLEHSNTSAGFAGWKTDAKLKMNFWNFSGTFLELPLKFLFVPTGMFLGFIFKSDNETHRDMCMPVQRWAIGFKP